jgi:DNA modification methylase
VQLPLPLGIDDSPKPVDLTRTSFSHGGVCPQSERLKLEQRYADLLEETDRFDRRLVSYQGNKGEILHSWIKYREGFSAQLVESLIREFGVQPGDTILEPFSGSATTLLTAKSLGIDAVGIEILPVCRLAWEAKSLVFDYDLDQVRHIYDLIAEGEPGHTDAEFPHLVITESAFPPQTERDLMYYTGWIEKQDVSRTTKTLLRLALTSVLEEVSYTRKDGQYLRWDRRSEKIQKRNRIRLSQDKKPIKGMDKGRLPPVKEVLLSVLGTLIEDIGELQKRPLRDSRQELIYGSALTALPQLADDLFAGVLTSPPYCNRYDYTRTYALELAYLGIGEDGIRELRQSQLSCTVENRAKVDHLRGFYESLGAGDRFEHTLQTVQNNPAFEEVNHALQIRWDRGEINNKGILSMVEGYFTELAFVFAEILRTCRSGAHVAFVNDNVRYGGEVIPVDLLTTNLADQLGFEPARVYVLPQRKGNSSQQMGRFGREALRKSITVWRKP